MWVDLCLAFIASCAFLIVPGFMLARAVLGDAVSSVAASPLFSAGMLALAGTLLPMAGIPCSWASVLACALVPSSLVWAVTGRRERPSVLPEALAEPLTTAGPLSRVSKGAVATTAAVVVGTVCAVAVYGLSLGDADAFFQNYDNAFHLNRIRDFVDGGSYSSFVGGFYPSAWHCLAALVCSATGVNVTVAVNALSMAVPAVAYPLSTTLLLSRLFGSNPLRVIWGCAACTSIAFFPWRIMLFGPLYPNVLAFSLMPAEAALFVSCLDENASGVDRVRWASLFILGGVSLALAQTNAVFSTAVFLAPFCLNRVWRGISRACAVRSVASGGRRALALTGAAALLVAFAAAWALLASLPALSAMVNYPRATPLDAGKAVRWAMTFSFILRRPQFVAGSIVVLGGLLLLLERGRRWLVVSYALLVAQYVIAVSVEGQLRTLVAGFWYNDYYRLAAAACVFAVPLLACGLERLVRLVAASVRWVCGKLRAAPRFGAVASGVCVAVLVAVLFAFNTFPFEIVPWLYRAYGFDAVAFELKDSLSTAERGPLDEEELAFLDEVAGVVGPGERVVNQPHDGSVFAYATDGVDVLFQQYSIADTPENVLLRAHLCDLASDGAVQAAIEELGVSYVLQLDHGQSSTGLSDGATFYADWYEPETWAGINSVDDDTPRFEVVLSEGDMRLYRIAS